MPFDYINPAYLNIFFIIVRLALMILMIASVSIFVVGGIKLLTAGGNIDQASEGKKTLVRCLSWLIVSVILFTTVNMSSDLLKS